MTPQPLRIIWNASAGSKGGMPTDPTSEEDMRALMARHRLGEDLVASSSEEEARQSAREAVRAGYAAVVAAGGDGSVGLIGTELLGSPTALGILPLGSVMNIARMLEIPRELDPAAAIIAAGRVRAIDVGFHGQEPFYESASVGMNAAIFKDVQQADEGDHRGLGRAIMTAFRFRPARMVIEMDDETVTTRALMVTASNGPYTGAGFTVAPDAVLDDGQLDINVFRHFSKLDLIRHFASIAFGRRAYSPHVRSYRSSQVRITGRQPLPARADSRDLGTTPVRFSVRQRVLRVLAAGGAPQ